MKTQMAQSSEFTEKKQAVNNAIRICVNCGSISVQIENKGIFCKDCGTFFQVREEEI